MRIGRPWVILSVRVSEECKRELRSGGRAVAEGAGVGERLLWGRRCRGCVIGGDKKGPLGCLDLWCMYDADDDMVRKREKRRQACCVSGK